VKFRTDVPGTVTGISFYKGPSNTGTHVGHLWTSTGTLLATVTFTNETASGWQLATFSSPVSILANTTYIASYYAPSGGYADNPGYFATSGVDSGPLHALASGVDGGNGQYAYATGGAFPASSSNANYWVDVQFTTLYTGAWFQKSVPDFNNGTQSGTEVTTASGGAVQQIPALEDDFAGTALGSTWTVNSWTSQGGGNTGVTTGASILSVLAAEVLSSQTYSNSPLEGDVQFGAVPFQQFGLATAFDSTAGNYWAVFSTAGGSNTLYARVNASGTTQDVNLGALPTGYHAYKITPTSTGFQFYVDGVLRTTIGITFPSGTALSVALSDFQGQASAALQADWVKVDQFATSGTLTSSVFTAGPLVNWGQASWNASLPANTAITIQTRSSRTTSTGARGRRSRTAAWWPARPGAFCGTRRRSRPPIRPLPQC
jgi:hypothetical protein